MQSLRIVPNIHSVSHADKSKPRAEAFNKERRCFSHPPSPTTSTGVLTATSRSAARAARA